MTSTETESIIREQGLDLEAVIQQRISNFLAYAYVNHNVCLCDPIGKMIEFSETNIIVEKYINSLIEIYDNERPSNRV